MTETKTREHLLVGYERMLATLRGIAGQVTTEEGDDEATEAEIGLPVEEVVSMAHDEMIARARATLNSLGETRRSCR